jgi:hypothetical protein
MVRNLGTHEIYSSIVNDFIGAWNSIASNSDRDIGRGNFMFASQAMRLLEFAARLYDKDTSARQNFSNDLYNIEPKYFTPLPGPCAKNTEFVLPYIGNTKGETLLWALFDLIRHGLVHQYQQIIAKLKDGKNFYISLTGAEYHRYLDMTARPYRGSHLAYIIDKDDDVALTIYPDILFRDIKEVLDKSSLLTRPFPYLTRPKSKGAGNYYYNFDTTSLRNSLDAGHQVKF